MRFPSKSQCSTDLANFNAMRAVAANAALMYNKLNPSSKLSKTTHAHHFSLFPALFVLALTLPAPAMDHVTCTRDGKTTPVDGRLILTAQDGGILFLARDGVLWNIVPSEKGKLTTDDQPFKGYNNEEMVRSVLSTLPQRFEVHQTAHYIIFYDTSKAYAQWCGSLFERLFAAFNTSWSQHGFKLADPQFPLVAVIFADKASYAKFSAKDLGEGAEEIIGYYNLSTNRMIMYDLSGAVGSTASGRGGLHSQMTQFLANPAAANTISTIVHEATHQIAFNSGLHQRLSDCPLWFSEGIAMYFETPDLRGGKGWAGVGAVNRVRKEHFKEYLKTRKPNSLETLIATDKRFRDPNLATDAYSEAWALTYYLLKQHPKEYVAYLKMLSKKQPLVDDGPEKRKAEFEQFFGPLKKVDSGFVAAMHMR